ncbi:MAG: geranylgeranylglycerol-phosphate geranylgeranyltransferase [Crocinitomicaceae bacterium]|nr:geranylgeranylglycerol-phosphate geranylgeranyltransferase [Crocinitomicaceae bacterium]
MLLLHFLRLIRFGNLLVIGVTMCIIQAFIANHGNRKYNLSSQDIPVMDTAADVSFQYNYFLKYNFDFNFLLLIISVLCIAGAGNIINDYFDIKADRVNKPEKMVVEKHIKRRWAIVWNWIFNAVGLGIAVYLSWKYSNVWIALIAFLTINFLWFYSALYKRRIFVGNIIVAVLVGIVPVYVMIFNFPISGFNVPYKNTYIEFGPLFIYEVVITVGIIAFMINLMREIIKDMADIRGDLHLSAKTVPIALGIRQTKTILSIMLIPLLGLITYYVYNITHYNVLFQSIHINLIESPILFDNLTVFQIFTVMSGIVCILGFVVLLTSNTRKKYLLSSNLLKLAMLFGMVSPLFL